MTDRVYILEYRVISPETEVLEYTPVKYITHTGALRNYCHRTVPKKNCYELNS